MENLEIVTNQSLPSIEAHRNFPKEREAWDNLVESTNAGIYLTYDWCQAWWTYYRFDRELRIFLIYTPETRQLVGVLPMFIDQIRIGLQQIRLAKTIGADFTIGTCELPILPEWMDQALEGIISELTINDHCDAILIGPTISTEPLASIKRCTNQMSSVARLIIIQSAKPHAIFQLPTSFDDYIRSLGKSVRKNYRNRWNRLHKNYEIKEEIIKEPFGEDRVFLSFMGMHAEQWKYKGMPGHFGDWPYAVRFHEDLAKRQANRDRFRMVRFSASGTPINYRYAYACGNILHSLLTARKRGKEWDNLALGQLSYIRLIAWAINEGYTKIDAGPGHYPHKLQYGAKELVRRSGLVIRNKLGSRWRCFIFRIQGKLINLFYYKIWFSRVAPKLGIRRVLWTSWIRRQLS